MTKVVLITGASKGIGRAVGTYLHEKGYRVFGTSRNPGRYQSVFPLVKMDLTDAGSIRAAIEKVVAEAGRIDVLVNNAGRGMIGPVEETPDEDIRHIFDTNLFGLIRVTRTVLPVMRKNHSGLIINISSIAGFAGLPYRGLYSATKAATMTVSETLRFELHGSGIKVVDIAPGDFKTGIAEGRIYVPNRKDSPYYRHYDKVLREIDQAVDSGLEPVVMGRLVEKIIRMRNPKMQYKIGPFVQKILPLAKVLLPQRIFENIMLNLYKLK